MHPIKYSSGPRWTKEEDEGLQRGYKTYGKEWKKISNDFVPSKTPKQIYTRYIEHLNPSIDHSKLSHKELELLAKLTNNGKKFKWAELVRNYFPQRTPNQIKNTYYCKLNIGNSSIKNKEKQTIKKVQELVKSELSINKEQTTEKKRKIDKDKLQAINCKEKQLINKKRKLNNHELHVVNFKKQQTTDKKNELSKHELAAFELEAIVCLTNWSVEGKRINEKL